MTGKKSDAPEIGHNSNEMSEDQRIALTFLHKKAYVAALAAKKRADADLKNVAKTAKAELGADGLANIKDMIALETEEGEVRHKAEVERMMQVARWVGLPVGAQGQLFAAIDPAPLSERAYNRGKMHGLAGEAFSSPHAPETEAYRSELAGWQDGQAVLAQGIRPPTPIEQAASGEFDDLPGATH